MDYYFFIKLRRKVPTRKHKLGMDTAVCRARSKEEAVAVAGGDTVYSLEVWVPDGERWHWSAIGAYPNLDMAVAVGEGFLSVKPYRVRRVTDVGDGFHDFLAEEVFANALTGRMRLLREKFGHEGRG